MDQALYYAKSLAVSGAVLDGAAFLLLERTQEVIRLNEAGSFIWQMISGTRTADQIVGRCIAEYEGDPDEIRGMVTEFLEQLQADGMIVVSTVPFEGVMCYG